MRKVYIKYNPYQVVTEILIDGEPVKKNSELNIGEERLQVWIEKLPQILVDECNTKDFEITFHGTVLDFEDLVAVAEEAASKGINIKCEHIPAKEVKDKEDAISEIFNDIQNGPFEELKQKDVIDAFEMAKSSDFPVNVVATMSAGKSTLINALLNKKLMPSKQEACTATITEIKDSDNENFHATVYNKDGELIETHPELTLEIMNHLNSNSEVSLIKTEGNIPFVDSRDVSLVLVDTPGPNNSRDPEHKAATYRMLSESSKTVVLYIMNATQLAANDDDNLLSHVANSMKVGGKQSKDRFIFVVNKLDDFRQGEDSVESSLEKVRKYLEDKGIMNPNIYPASALTALNIRTILADVDLEEALDSDDDVMAETALKIRKFNRNTELHLDAFAPLPPSVRGEMNTLLAEAKETGDKKLEALIHTGIIPVEAAIRMYVEKYAKTAKIKSIVDTFDKKLESARSFETTKQTIVNNQDKQKEILAQIHAIEEKLKNGEEAKEFKKKIAEINYDKEIAGITNEIIKKAQEKITAQLESCNSKLSKVDAESICLSFAKFSETLQAEVQVKLENAVTSHMQKSAEALLAQYREKIASLSQDIAVGDIAVNPFEILDGEIGTSSNVNALVAGLTKTESVLVKEGHWVANSSKKWYKPWTWFQESGHYTDDIYEDREYVDGSELAKKFFAPVQKQLFENNRNAVEYAKKQVVEIKNIFNAKFDELDRILNDKLNEMKKYASDNENVERIIKETQERLQWLEEIQARIKSILDI